MFGLSAMLGQRLHFVGLDHLRFLRLAFVCSRRISCVYYAGSYGASGLLAVVFSTASLIIVLMVALIRGNAEMDASLAAMIGISGVLLLYLPELQGSETALVSLSLPRRDMFLALAILSRRNPAGGSSGDGASTWGMAYGTGLLGLFALVNGSPFIVEFTPRYLLSLAWLVVISSVITFACYLTLVGRIGPVGPAMRQ